MPRFRVLIHGENAEAARRSAVEIISNDPRLLDLSVNSDDDPARVSAETVIEVDSDGNGETGYILYSEDEEKDP
jgi:hypothetical protein